MGIVKEHLIKTEDLNEVEFVDATTDLFPNAESIDLVTLDIDEEDNIKIIKKKPVKRKHLSLALLGAGGVNEGRDR